jgi:hypothetical protein
MGVAIHRRNLRSSVQERPSLKNNAMVIDRHYSYKLSPERFFA